jgi:hypothetical protein
MAAPDITRERDARIFQCIKVDQAQFEGQIMHQEEMALQRFIDGAPQLAPGHQDIVAYTLNEEGLVISCINWFGKHYITGTGLSTIEKNILDLFIPVSSCFLDIVRILYHRYQFYMGGLPPHSKKFEEGIFSDLRRLSVPHDCELQPTRSDFLIYLFNNDCVRSKKKQKVFFWHSFARCANSVFSDALEREMARMEMARAVNMSMEEFVKSGIVPSGGANTSQLDAQSLGYDWTIAALHPEYPNQPGHQAPSLEHIHIIRNDMATFLNRVFRLPVQKRRALMTPELTTALQQEFIRRLVLPLNVTQEQALALMSSPAAFATDAQGNLQVPAEGQGLMTVPPVHSGAPSTTNYAGAGRKRFSDSANAVQGKRRSRASEEIHAGGPRASRSTSIDSYYEPDDDTSVSEMEPPMRGPRPLPFRYIPAHLYHGAPPPTGRPPRFPEEFNVMPFPHYGAYGHPLPHSPPYQPQEMQMPGYFHPPNVPILPESCIRPIQQPMGYHASSGAPMVPYLPAPQRMDYRSMPQKAVGGGNVNHQIVPERSGNEKDAAAILLDFGHQ